MGDNKKVEQPKVSIKDGQVVLQRGKTKNILKLPAGATNVRIDRGQLVFDTRASKGMRYSGSSLRQYITTGQIPATKPRSIGGRGFVEEGGPPRIGAGSATRQGLGGGTVAPTGPGETTDAGLEEDPLAALFGDGGVGGIGGSTSLQETQIAAGTAAAELEQRKKESLAAAVSNVLGQRLSERASARDAASSNLQSALPFAVTPEQAALLGKQFAGISGGNPLQTSEVPVEFGAIGTQNLDAETAAAEAIARQLLGAAEGMEVERAQGGAITPTGVSTINIDQILKTLLGQTDVLNALAEQYGTTPQAVMESVLAPFGGGTGRKYYQAIDPRTGLDTIFQQDSGGQLRRITPGQFEQLGIKPTEIQKLSNLEGFQLGPQADAASLAPTKTLKAQQFEEQKKERLAGLYANPRRVFETAFLQAGLRPGADVVAAQRAITPEELEPEFNRYRAAESGRQFGLPKTPGAPTTGDYLTGPGFTPLPPFTPRPPSLFHGGRVYRAAKGARVVKSQRNLRGLFRAAHGKSVEGPAIILVGEGANDEGIGMGTHEYVLAPPGTVIAPGKAGEEPSMEAAMDAIMRQIKKTKTPRANKGLTARKAKTMLHEGTAQGHDLTPAQQRFFGFIAGGGKPTRAQFGTITGPGFVPQQPFAGISPPSPTGNLTGTSPPRTPRSTGKRRSLFDIAVAPGMEQIRRGSLFDPLAGGSPELRALFAQGIPNLQQYGRQSGAQRGLTEAAISSQGVDPEDLYEYQRRSFEGFNPRIQAGQTARFLFR